MSADVLAITVYFPICHECHWEGDDSNSQAAAEAQAAAHDRMKHS